MRRYTERRTVPSQSLRESGWAWRPQAGMSGSPPESALGTAVCAVAPNRDGKNDSTGWRLVLFKDAASVPREREGLLAFFP